MPKLGLLYYKPLFIYLRMLLEGCEFFFYLFIYTKSVSIDILKNENSVWPLIGRNLLRREIEEITL